MSILLRQLIRQYAQKAASDPETRAKVIKAAGGLVGQAKQISKQNDRAYAAGRAFRRTFDKWQNDK